MTKQSESEEYNSDKEVVGSDCLCVLGSKKHLPNCEYADTPAKEWREELRTLMQMEAMPTLEAFIQNLIDSRDAEIAQLKEELTDIVKDS